MKLTRLEVEALLAAAGNVDPAMFEDFPAEEGDRLYDAWLSGQDKLRAMLAAQKKAPPKRG